MDQITALMRLDRVVRKAQAVLRAHLTDSRMSDRDALEQLRDVLDDEDFLQFQRILQGREEGPEAIGPEDPLPYR